MFTSPRRVDTGAVMQNLSKIEWPTVALFVCTYAVWIWAVFWLAGGAPWLAVPVAAVAIALHGSLQHEAIHGHPTQWASVNTALAWPPLTLVIPFLRFRDTHLAHHRDANLTDPYDDPETHFMMPADWAALPALARRVLMLNNTLAGRLLLGPLIGTACFLLCDLRNRHDDARVAPSWGWHLIAVAAVLMVVWLAPMPLWAYVLSAYLALALLRIRTFLEHQAHEQTRARSVIIEDRGPLALLFLNNNLHAVHHAHPQVAWYDLPALYQSHRARFLAMNGGYRFASYGEVFRRFLFRRKDPVAHPLRD
ncbi:MAG: fatty acid desaturase [Pseudomonadota bacterium]